MAFFEEGIEVQIDANSGGFDQTMDGVFSQLHSVRGAVAGLGAALGALSTAALAGAAKAAANFEEQMVEVEKVTNAQTAREMGDAIQRMADEMPIAQERLARIAADAGRFGVRGVENMEAFTESVAKMSIATNLSAQEAGESLSRLAELTGTPVDKIENLGSVINELSNNFATSSSEVVDSMLRSSAALSQLGLNQSQISGLSAALNEVSESSQRAGTRLRRVAQEMMNPKNVEGLASALGMTTEEFTQMRSESPLDLIQQMAVAFSEGGEQADALRTTLSTASRQAIAGLAQNTDGLTQALETANTQYEEGTSLQKEYEAASSTFNSELQRVKNQIRNVGINIGENLLPPLATLLGHVSDGIETFSAFNEETGGMAGTFALVAGALGGFVAAAASVISLLGGMSAVAAAAGAAFTVLTGPVGVAIAAIAAFSAAWSTNFLGIRDITRTVINRVSGILQGFIDFFAPLYAKHLSGIADEFMETFNVAMQAIRRFVQWATPFAKQYISIYTRLWDMFGDEIKTVVRFAFAATAGIIKQALRTIRTYIKVAMAVLSGDWKEAWNILSNYVEDTFDGLISFVGEWGGRLLDKIVSVVKDAGRAAAGALKDAFNNAIPSSIDVPEASIAGRSIGGGSIELPSLDTGGMIEQGGLARVHAGERVIPAAQVSNRGEQTIRVEQETSASAEVTRRLDDLLDEVRSGGGDVVLQVGERELARVVESTQNDFGASLEVNQ